MDRLLAILNAITNVVTQTTAVDPIEVANYAAYVDNLESTIPDTGTLDD
jgi:hypothetical protein